MRKNRTAVKIAVAVLALVVFACGQPVLGTSLLSVVDMSPEGSPSLPPWLKNGMSEKLYVGVSVPSTDAKAAKASALANAVAIYSMANVGTVARYLCDYEVVLDGVYQTSRKTSFRGEYSQGGFSLTILQEYYNQGGEYYVLCEIVPDKNVRNFF